MKSVVVEASTVAKAIELAWQKAEKPEEFFIRILQEHSSGFLGFNAQKAKIVFFFKNIPKADTLFPPVLKQREYASLFDNEKIKTPSQVDVVDHELNKNVSLGNHKKHPHGKKKNNHPQPRKATPDAKVQPSPTVPAQQKQQLNTKKTQVKVELPKKSVPVKQSTPVQKEAVVKKHPQQKVKASSIPQQVKKISKVVQSQVIEPKVSVLQQIEEIIKPTSTTPTPKTSAPRVIQKMKRRPLAGADQSVSGITRSVPKSVDTTDTPKSLISDDKDGNK